MCFKVAVMMEKGITNWFFSYTTVTVIWMRAVTNFVDVAAIVNGGDLYGLL